MLFKRSNKRTNRQPLNVQLATIQECQRAAATSVNFYQRQF